MKELTVKQMAAMGGRAAAKSMTAEQRKERAKKAGEAAAKLGKSGRPKKKVEDTVNNEKKV